MQDQSIEKPFIHFWKWNHWMRLLCWFHQWDQTFVIVEILVRLPRTILICIIKINMCRIKVSKNRLFTFENEITAWDPCVDFTSSSVNSRWMIHLRNFVAAAPWHGVAWLSIYDWEKRNCQRLELMLNNLLRIRCPLHWCLLMFLSLWMTPFALVKLYCDWSVILFSKLSQKYLGYFDPIYT